MKMEKKESCKKMKKINTIFQTENEINELEKWKIGARKKAAEAAEKAEREIALNHLHLSTLQEMKNFPEFEDWVFEKDFFESDLITIKNYMFQKTTASINSLGYELNIEKNGDYVYTYLKPTNTSEINFYETKINNKHQIFNTQIDFLSLKNMNVNSFSADHIVQTHWKQLNKHLTSTSYYFYGTF